MTNTTSVRKQRNGVLSALGNGVIGGLRHWRLILLAWLAGLATAALAAMPVVMLFNQALGHYPDAARVVAGQDAATIIESVMTLPDGGAMRGIANIAEGMATALLLAALLIPWLTGMLVASLREGRALGFGELWAGGWREYGRQLRLLLVSLIPWIVVGIVAALASAWARQGADTRILQSVGDQRQTVMLWIVGIASLLAWISIECARAAFAADPALRSAFRAWLRGLGLMVKRPFAVVLVVLATLVVGGGLAMLMQKSAMQPSASNFTAVLLAQLGVFVLWWMRIARLSALASISPGPAAQQAVQASTAPDPAPPEATSA